MNLLELIFTVCAIGNTGMCEDKHIAVEQQLSVTACVMQAQPTMARWVAENPNWTIVRWHCDYSANRRQKA
ncbi:MAG: hypothetical protein ACHQAY_14305 [Hyphomicrobiales bacterium]